MKKRLNKKYYKVFLYKVVESLIQTNISVYRLEDI